MKFLEKVVLGILLTTLASCGSQIQPEQSKKIGSDFRTIKGDIKEDLPVLSGSEFQRKLLDNSELSNTLKWHHLDLAADKLYGVSADRAYAELNLKQRKEIIVAVIDSGVDYKHEDLKDVMWTNPGEIADNGIDDDNNGYIDDVYGWNFMGGADGRNINEETLEETRIYKRLLDKLKAGELLSDSEAKVYKVVKEMVTTNFAEFSTMYNEAKADEKTVAKHKATLKLKLGIQILDRRSDIEAIESEDTEILTIKEELLSIYDKYTRGFAGIERAIEQSEYYVKAGYNINFNARAEIVGDDPSDFSDVKYGNNDVKGPDSGHGTHVSGIIAAKRDNNIGMNGIAGNVKIMALRAVPNGDERDKDIVLAVKYAVDNGAHIINMSFGKKFSPYKAEVDAAFLYAASRGVLLMHAAGNDGKNNDFVPSYPNATMINGSGVLQTNMIPTWFEVGASTKDLGLNLPAFFSNFGKDTVTLFSPGHRIYSTTPEDTYAAYSGTSMATPAAAGVAALLMSEFPTMTGPEAGAILKHTASVPANLMVRQPSEDSSDPDFRIPVPFASLSQEGAVINAYEAVKLARELSSN